MVLIRVRSCFIHFLAPNFAVVYDRRSVVRQLPQIMSPLSDLSCGGCRLPLAHWRNTGSRQHFLRTMVHLSNLRKDYYYTLYKSLMQHHLTHGPGRLCHQRFFLQEWDSPMILSRNSLWEFQHEYSKLAILFARAFNLGISGNLT